MFPSSNTTSGNIWDLLFSGDLQLQESANISMQQAYYTLLHPTTTVVNTTIDVKNVTTNVTTQEIQTNTTVTY